MTRHDCPARSHRWSPVGSTHAWSGYGAGIGGCSHCSRDGSPAKLTDATGLSMAEYTVLSNLAEAEERRFRVTELAEKMQWEQSRLSHQLRRMEERGLVSRKQAETDARGAMVTLTRVGLKTIVAAAPVHFEGVRKHAIDRLDRAQLDASTTSSTPSSIHSMMAPCTIRPRRRARP